MSCASFAGLIRSLSRSTPDRRGIVTGEGLAGMKTTALIVNTRRAGVIARRARRGSNGREPGFATVDVFQGESVVGAAHPLLKMNNVIAMAHLGYVEKENYGLLRPRGRSDSRLRGWNSTNVLNSAALDIRPARLD